MRPVTIHMHGLASFIERAKDARTLKEKQLWLRELLCWIREAKPRWRPTLVLSAVDIAERSPENSAAMADLLRSLDLLQMNGDLGVALLVALG